MANDVQSDGYQGQANETTDGDQYNALTFLVNQIVSGKWTATLCQVKSVSGGGPTAAPGTVSVQPLVNQMNGQNQATPHGNVNNIPVFRLQGGTSAFIVDPIVGDIGILVVASRDISSVKKNSAVSNPGSNRTFDPADGMYIGGFLNKAPTQYVQISKDGITLKFSDSVSITINGDGVTVKVGGTTFSVANGKITLDGIVWETHVHLVSGQPSGPPKAP